MHSEYVIKLSTYISYIDYTVTENYIVEAVKTDIKGAGRNIGYRAMTAKLRQKHDLKVPRDFVMMQ